MPWRGGDSYSSPGAAISASASGMAGSATAVGQKWYRFSDWLSKGHVTVMKAVLLFSPILCQIND